MPVLTVVGGHSTGDVYPASDYNTYTRDNINYLVSAGANLASGATLIPTNEFHIVTGTTPIDNLSPATPLVGQQHRLQFLSGATVRHNGGGTGNIRFADGQNRVMAPGAEMNFFYDGTVWWGVTSTFRIPIVPYDLTTTTETDLLSAGGAGINLNGYTIPINGMIRIVTFGDWLQQSGSAKDVPRFKLKLGTTTLIFSPLAGANVVASSALRYPWRMTCEIFNSAVNAQQVSMFGRLLGLWAGSAGSAFTTGNGILGVAAYSGTGLYVSYDANNVAAVDTTAAQALQLTCTLPTATSTDVYVRGGYVEVLS